MEVADPALLEQMQADEAFDPGILAECLQT
jgi:hypothetical protein